MIGCDHCEEWYHGDCVNISEKESKYIKRYYCKECRNLNSQLHIVYKSKYKEEREKHHHKKSSHHDREKEERKKEKEKEERKKEKEKKRKKKDKEKDRDREDDQIKKPKKSQEPSSESKPERTSSVDSKPAVANSPKPRSKPIISDDEDADFNLREKDLKLTDSESEDSWEPAIKQPSKPTKSKETKSSVHKKVQQKSGKIKTGTKRKRKQESDSDVDPTTYFDSTASLDGSRQCYGHKCIKEARDGSKYCSDNCGINLASLRIMQTLPDRIREWNLMPCEADKRNRKELESIRAKQDNVKANLEQLQRDFKALEDLIAKGKSQTIEERDSDDEDDSSAMEMTVHCVTCGSDVQTRTAIRHMERCYNKMESQTSFASRFKTQIEDDRMFCDFYNPKEGTYCKRLQVLCPEHNPDEKKVPRDDEVCGYPIQKELFGKPGEFCRSSKKACQAHYCWEKLRRAELDMERVKEWMKVDELIEQERQVRTSMSNRAGVLGLLLHR